MSQLTDWEAGILIALAFYQTQDCVESQNFVDFFPTNFFVLLALLTKNHFWHLREDDIWEEVEIPSYVAYCIH